MALVSRAGDMLLDAEELEIYGRAGILHGGVPFVGPGHGDGDGVARLDANVQVATSGCRMVDAANKYLPGSGVGLANSGRMNYGSKRCLLICSIGLSCSGRRG
jgi:hypothetical protein